MESSERRRDARALISLPAYIVRRGEVEAAQTLDASYRGLCLRTVREIPVRQLVRIRLSLPGHDKPIETHGVVMRSFRDALGRWQLGMRFFALNGQEQVDWESFVASHIYHRRAAA